LSCIISTLAGCIAINISYILSRTPQVLFRRNVQVNSYLTPLWTTVASTQTLMPHLSKVYRCRPLPNLHQTNKLHSFQHVNVISAANSRITTSMHTIKLWQWNH